MTIHEHDLIKANEDELATLQKLEAMLKREEITAVAQSHPLPHIVASNGEDIEITPTLLHALRLLVSYAASDTPVHIIASDQLLTTQEAADLLHISRPSLIKLLEDGEIPYTKVGTHRRIQYEDVIRYKQCRRERRLQALSEIAGISQEAGEY